MSNDIKYWLWRIGLAVSLTINGSILMKIMALGWSGKTSGWWDAAFFVSMAASILVGFMYLAAKRSRWSNTMAAPQNDLETLNNYVKMQNAERDAQQAKDSQKETK